MHDVKGSWRNPQPLNDVYVYIVYMSLYLRRYTSLDISLHPYIYIYIYLHERGLRQEWRPESRVCSQPFNACLKLLL